MCADLLSSAGILAKCSNDELNSFLFMSCLWAEQTLRHNAVLLSSAVILAKCSNDESAEVFLHDPPNALVPIEQFPLHVMSMRDIQHNAVY